MEKNKKYKAYDRLIPTTAVLLWIVWVLTMVFLFPCLWFSVDGYSAPDNILAVKEDDGTDWSNLDQLNIFTSLGENGYLAPETSGSYSFILVNEANYPVSYVINVTDKNIHNVPIRFRLKDGYGNYMVGSEEEWMDITYLEAIPGKMDYQAEKLYTIDWYWDTISDPEDTKTGIAAQNGLIYTLNFLILSEQAGAVVSFNPFNFAIGFADCWLAFLITLLLLVVTLILTALIIRFYNKKKHEREEETYKHHES